MSKLFTTVSEDRPIVASSHQFETFELLVRTLQTGSFKHKNCQYEAFVLMFNEFFLVLLCCFCNFAVITISYNSYMKKSNEQREADVLREKANHYLICFLDRCPLRDRCLRYLVGQHASSEPWAHTSINPLHAGVQTAECAMFRPNVRVVKKKGMMHFYHDMPGYMENNIRQALIRLFKRTYYFEMRRGDRLITPEQQQQIEQVCRRHGWQGELNYDGEEEDWAW